MSVSNDAVPVQVMKTFSFILFVSALTACAAKNENIVSETDSAIFTKETASKLLEGVCYRPPSGITGFWSPEERDIAGIEIGLDEFLRTRDPSSEKRIWNRYRRQVAGVIVNNQKLIFISYSPKLPPEVEARVEEHGKKESLKAGRPYDPNDWKKHPVRIFDGGSSVFRVIFDPQKKKFLWYEENGVA